MTREKQQDTYLALQEIATGLKKLMVDNVEFIDHIDDLYQELETLQAKFSLEAGFRRRLA